MPDKTKFSLIEKENINRIYAQMIEELYLCEKDRGERIQRQTSRLPVFQTLFFTAIYTVLPTLLENFAEKKFYIWFFITVISVLGIVSLMFTLFSQWKLHSKNKLTIDNIDMYIMDYRRKQYEINLSLDIVIKIDYFKEKIKTIEEENKIRDCLLIVGMHMFLLMILITIVFIVFLCI